MNKKISILVLLSLPFFMNDARAACSIEKGPPPEVVKYINDVKTEIAKIRAEAGGTNKCGTSAGSFASERRFLEYLDRIDLDGSATDDIVSLPSDIAMDFFYNVSLAAEGKTRSPVTNQGKLFKSLENTTIIPTLESITSLCSLDTKLPSGGTPETRIGNILRVNRKIERFFWTATTTENPTSPEGLEKYDTLINSIKTSYSPESTSACNSEQNIENIASTIMTKLGNLTKGTKNGHKAWEEAIALFQGKNKGTAEYVKLQSRLLQVEMARQGLSQNAKKAMLSNLTCPEQKTDPSSPPEERAKADFECQRQYVIGFDTVVSGLKPKIFQSKTTDEFIKRTLTFSREKNRISTDISNYWGNLVKLKSGDEPLNAKLLNDLVDIHLNLLTTIEALEKKAIPDMKKNCQNGSADVKCPF